MNNCFERAIIYSAKGDTYKKYILFMYLMIFSLFMILFGIPYVIVIFVENNVSLPFKMICFFILLLFILLFIFTIKKLNKITKNVDCSSFYRVKEAHNYFIISNITNTEDFKKICSDNSIVLTLCYGRTRVNKMRHIAITRSSYLKIYSYSNNELLDFIYNFLNNEGLISNKKIEVYKFKGEILNKLYGKSFLDDPLDYLIIDGSNFVFDNKKHSYISKGLKLAYARFLSDVIKLKSKKTNKVLYYSRDLYKTNNESEHDLFSILYNYRGYDFVFRPGITDPLLYVRLNTIFTNNNVNINSIDGYDKMNINSNVHDFYDFYDNWIEELMMKKYVINTDDSIDIFEYCSRFNSLLSVKGYDYSLDINSISNMYEDELSKYTIDGKSIPKNYKYELLESNVIAGVLRSNGFELISLFNGFDNDIKTVVRINEIDEISEIESNIMGNY